MEETKKSIPIDPETMKKIEGLLLNRNVQIGNYDELVYTWNI